MMAIGALGFLSPWLLLGLLALPALWLLLRVSPPSPSRITFPGVRLLLGLRDEEVTPHRTPWWLLLLRMLAAAAAIIAFAGPVLNPEREAPGSGPVFIVMDGGWASAPDWERRRAAALSALGQAERAGRAVSFHNLAQPPAPGAGADLRPAGDWRAVIEALSPAPWRPLRTEYAGIFAGIDPPEGAAVIWLQDGLEHGDQGALAQSLAGLGELRIIRAAAPARAITAPRLEDGKMIVTALRADDSAAETLGVAAYGEGADGAGERRLALAAAAFSPGDLRADAEIALPVELRNQISRVALTSALSAGAVALADERARRRRVGVSSGSAEPGAKLLSPGHYLRSALAGFAEVTQGGIDELAGRAPDIIILDDTGELTADERAALEAFTDEGGMLIRFAGPHMARGQDLARAAAPGGDDSLLPVRLRAGGRSVGGAMAWEAPQEISPFSEESPFHGLDIPADVTVSRQILARIGPDLASKTWAALKDGTPLVTAVTRGAGRIVLFHIPANAEWSSLPLSGLFGEMLQRLSAMAGVSAVSESPQPGAPLRLVAAIDGFGGVQPADEAQPPVAPGRFAAAPGPDAPPGLYENSGGGFAFNLFTGPDAGLRAAPPPPAGADVERLSAEGERLLGGIFLALALGFFAADLLGTLRLSGRRPAFLALALTIAIGVGGAEPLRADEAEDRAIAAAADTVLAWVQTGDARTDRLSEAGLRGLSRVLAARTAVEPGPPARVRLEFDDISLYPLLYWPVTAGQPTPSAESYARLNEYMRHGGMIIFDTQDAHMAAGGAGPNTGALRRLASGLDLPPLTTVSPGHVLTRSFYLLDDFPGRWPQAPVWVAAGSALSVPDGLIADPNDGVTPVIIGAAGWAGAWAVSESGEFLAPVSGGDSYRQREMAFRVGVNMVMYALTGNYKSDQVHVPALLERLGN